MTWLLVMNKPPPIKKPVPCGAPFGRAIRPTEREIRAPFSRKATLTKSTLPKIFSGPPTGGEGGPSTAATCFSSVIAGAWSSVSIMVRMFVASRELMFFLTCSRRTTRSGSVSAA